MYPESHQEKARDRMWAEQCGYASAEEMDKARNRRHQALLRLNEKVKAANQAVEYEKIKAVKEIIADFKARRIDTAEFSLLIKKQCGKSRREWMV